MPYRVAAPDSGKAVLYSHVDYSYRIYPPFIPTLLLLQRVRGFPAG